MRPRLHRLAHQLFRIRQQQAVLREGNDFAVKACAPARQYRLQIFQVFQAGNRLYVAVAAGDGGPFGLDQVDQLFGAFLRVGL